jgi:hypothetical protein
VEILIRGRLSERRQSADLQRGVGDVQTFVAT